MSSNSTEALTIEEQTELQDLVENVASVWIKENAIFALNRILETTEKIMQYKEALEKGIAEFKLKSKEKLANDKGNSSPLTEDSVDSGEALPVLRRTPDLDDDGAGLLLCEDPHEPLAEVEAALNKSLVVLDAQVPTAPVLEDYSLAGRKRGYTFPEAESDGKKLTKLGRLGESFDGGFPFFSSSKYDEADVPEVGRPFVILLVCVFCRKGMDQCIHKLIWQRKEGNAFRKLKPTIINFIVGYVLNLFCLPHLSLEVCIHSRHPHSIDHPASFDWVDLQQVLPDTLGPLGDFPVSRGTVERRPIGSTYQH